MQRATARRSPPERRSALGVAARTVLVAGLPVLLALIIRGDLRSDPFYDLLVVDARTSHEMAASWASDSPLAASEPFWQPPGYTLFLSWLYRLEGPSPEFARSVQIGLLGLLAWLVHSLARRWFGAAAAWGAWGLLSVNGPFYLEALQLLNTIVGTTALVASVWWADGAVAPPRGEPAPLRAGLGGLCLGFAGITIAQLLVVAPVLLIGWFLRRPSSAARTRVITAFSAGVLIPVALVGAHNLRASGEWIPISYNGGINFWLGNNPDHDRTVGLRPGREWAALTAEPLEHGATSYGAQSRYFYEKAFRWMTEEPAAAAALLARKAHQWVHGFEILRNQEIYPWADRSPLLRTLLWARGVAFPFGLLFPLAVLGFALAWRSPEHRLAARRLAALVAALALVVIAFFVTSRYRLPAVPFLAIAGGHVFGRAAGCGTIGGIWSVLSTRRAWLPAVLLSVVALVVSNARMPAEPRDWNADAYVDLGFQRQMEGDRAQAESLYRKALVLDASNLQAVNNLGGLLVESGRPADALPLFERVLAVYPEDRKARNNLGSAFLRMGEAYQAGKQFLILSRLVPPEPGAAENVARSHELAAAIEQDWMAREPDRYLDVLERALASDPANEFLRERLRALLRSRGLDERARTL